MISPENEQEFKSLGIDTVRRRDRASIPCVEIVYVRKDVRLNLIDLHGHSGPRVRQET